MTDTEKVKQQSDWTKTYTLTPEQARKLLEAKLKRAQVMQSALKQREELCGFR